MKKYLYIVLFALAWQPLLSQEKKISTDFMPKSIVGQTVYVTKFDALTPNDLNELIEKKPSRKSTIIENYNGYNLIFYRKLNIAITEMVEEYNDEKLVVMHERDIRENLTNEYRFVVRSDMTREDIVTDNWYNSQFYIYDQENDQQYLSFPNIESLIKALREINKRYESSSIETIRQGDLNRIAADSLPKVKKGMSSGVAWALGGAFYGGFVYLINYLANL